MSVSDQVSRLGAREAGARRVAILDLIAAKSLEADEALLRHLESERDERAAILIIRHLGDAGRIEAARVMPVLWKLYEDRQTAVRIAHAAVVVHDRMAVRGGR